MSTQARRTQFRNAVAAWTGIGGSEHVLYVSAESLIALRRDEYGWQLQRVFELRESDGLFATATTQASSSMEVPKEFRQWIAHWRGDQYRVVVDSVDEEIETDELPRVHGSDRVKVLNRRLRQRFRDAALTTWIGPRRADSSPWKRALRAGGAAAPAGAGQCTMMAALRQRNPMILWIEAAIEAGARIGSIESPTLRAPRLLRRLGPRPTALLVSVQPAGLRETLVQEGEIRFTRLLPLAAPVPWSQVATELERTVRFLMMSRASLRPLIQAGDFPVHLVAEGIDGPAGAFAASLHLDGDIVVPIKVLDAQALRLPAVRLPDDSTAMPVLGAVPALLRGRRRRMRGEYASTAMRRNWRNARSLASVWSLALLSLVATVGANVWMAYALHDSVDPAIERQRLVRIEAVRSQAHELEQQLASLSARAPDMQGVIELADQLQSRHVDALATLQLVASGMEQDPALTINDLSWEPQRPLAAAGAPASAPQSPQQEPGPAANATSDTVVRLAGVVDPGLSKALANRQVDALLSRLRAACGCAGRVLELPYDPSMDVAYSNSLRHPNTERLPHFTLELERPSASTTAQGDGAGAKSAAATEPVAAPAAAPAGGHRDA
ncbi:hypothetical protein SBBP1_20023 [Burkholderiales bacterium]|nr:hypothetical protein SBBP1_20023 [Burkholderiales bacterium]